MDRHGHTPKGCSVVQRVLGFYNYAEAIMFIGFLHTCQTLKRRFQF